MRIVYWPPQHLTGYRSLRMFDRDGYDIGRLVWVVCDTAASPDLLGYALFSASWT
ncbi:hypothetical protein ACGFNV_36125 [Streptomyces sp. NPDC048751]|uniref:hypothetical protein n=1 Tax=Streptomyces sp. NPDC048751 TaxID=3365591 RepID=UPI0037153CD0